MLLDDLRAAGGELRTRRRAGRGDEDGGRVQRRDVGGRFGVRIAGDRDGRQVDPEDGRDAAMPMTSRASSASSVVEPRPALVPFTFHEPKLAADCRAGGRFGRSARDRTARRLSAAASCSRIAGFRGPAILQISSYWREGDEIIIDLAHGRDVFEELRRERTRAARSCSSTMRWRISFPKRLADQIAARTHR